MGQDTCIAVVGVTQALVDEANARLHRHYDGPQAATFAFFFWQDPADAHHTQGFMSCPEAWFETVDDRGYWPRIAAFLEAALIAWPDEVVYYYSDEGSPQDGYEVGPETIDSGWELWRDPEIHREWWNMPTGCSHDEITLMHKPAAGDLPVARPTRHMTLTCRCGLEVEAPIEPQDVPAVEEVLHDSALRPAFLRMMQTAKDCNWGTVAAAVSATAI